MRRTLILGMVVAGILFGISLLQSQAAEPVLLTADRDSYLIGLHVHILDDPDRKLTIEEASSPSFSGSFRPSDKMVPNFGFASSCHWLRFTVTNESSLHGAWVLEFQEAGVDHVDLYVPDSGGTFAVSSAGDAVPMKHREIPYRFPSFRLRIPPGGTRTYFMRLESSRGLIRAPLLLSSEQVFEASVNHYTKLFGLFAGALGIVILYNLMFWATLRDRIYLYYLLSILFTGLFTSVYTGWAYVHLWPDSPVLGNMLRMVFVGLMLFWTVLFTRDFLNTRDSALYLDYVAQAIAGVGLAVSVLCFVAYNASIGLAVVGLAAGVVLSFVIAVKGLVKGDRYAVYYLASYAVLLFGLTYGVLVFLRIIPVTGLGLRAFAVGLPITLLGLSLAMADRFMHIQRQYTQTLEREVSQRTEQLNEVLSDLAKSHEVLELKVQERTAELADSNAELKREIEERIQEGGDARRGSLSARRAGAGLLD